MRSPYIVPGATRLTVTLAALPERSRPSDGRHASSAPRSWPPASPRACSETSPTTGGPIFGTMYVEQALELRQDAVCDMAVRAHGRDGRPARPAPNALVPVVRGRELRQACADVAVVGDGLSRAGAADEGEVPADTDVERDVDAVEVLATSLRSRPNRRRDCRPGRPSPERRRRGPRRRSRRRPAAADRRGATMLNGVRSDGCSERLSTTEKPSIPAPGVRHIHRRPPADLLLRSTRRGSSPTDGRPSRLRNAGSKLLVRTFVPKLVFDITPQRSPPLPRRSCAAGFDRSQSGTKLRFASVQARVTPAVPNVGVVCGIRSVGLVLA